MGLIYGLPSWLFIILIIIALFDLLFRVLCLVDLLRGKDKRSQRDVVTWIVIIAFVNFGWIIYLLLGRSKREGDIRDEKWV